MFGSQGTHGPTSVPAPPAAVPRAKRKQPLAKKPIQQPVSDEEPEEEEGGDSEDDQGRKRKRHKGKHDSSGEGSDYMPEWASVRRGL